MSTTRSDYGSAFISIATHGDKTIELDHLIVNKENTTLYINYVNEKYKTLNLKPGVLDNVTEQPSPLGIALVAHYYNAKGDQTTKLYVATTIVDCQKIVEKMRDAPNGEKAVVICQPTDNHDDEWMHYRSHKSVLYFEKKANCLHVVFADIAPVPSINDFYKKHFDKLLASTKHQYYFLTPLKHNDNAVYLQSDFWNCFTHTMRVARVIAKHTDFLMSLALSNAVTDSNKTEVNFKMPALFARSADTNFSRQICLSFFNTEEKLRLEQTYNRHPNNYSYPIKFTNKYLNLIKQTAKQYSSAELHNIIRGVDAGCYKKPSIQEEKSQPYELNTQVRPH